MQFPIVSSNNAGVVAGLFYRDLITHLMQVSVFNRFKSLFSFFLPVVNLGAKF